MTFCLQLHNLYKQSVNNHTFYYPSPPPHTHTQTVFVAGAEWGILFSRYPSIHLSVRLSVRWFWFFLHILKKSMMEILQTH